METRAPEVMETTGDSGGTASGGGRFSLDPGEIRRVGVIVVLLLLVLFLVPAIVSDYYVDTSTQVVTYAIVALGLGVLVGRVGLVSLGQAAVLPRGPRGAGGLVLGPGL